VGEGGVVAAGVLEELEGRHLDAIGGDGVVRLIAAMADVRADRGEERLGSRVALHRLQNRLDLGRVVMRGQAVDLLDVEHAIALHEEGVALAFLAGLLVDLGLVHAVGVDDRRSFLVLALAHRAAEGFRLAGGHPDRSVVAGRDRFAPERDDVDPGIGLAVMTQRPGDPAGRVRGVPGLMPGPHAVLKRGDDPVRDAGVDVFLGRLHRKIPFLGFWLIHPSVRAQGKPADGDQRGPSRPNTAP
jgi:hypothetical protein